MDERILPGTLLRTVDPNNLYPGIRVYDKSTRRQGEIVKIEPYGRGQPEVYIVWDGSDTPVNTVDHPSLVVLED